VIFKVLQLEHAIVKATLERLCIWLDQVIEGGVGEDNVFGRFLELILKVVADHSNRVHQLNETLQEEVRFLVRFDLLHKVSLP